MWVCVAIIVALDRNCFLVLFFIILTTYKIIFLLTKLPNIFFPALGRTRRIKIKQEPYLTNPSTNTSPFDCNLKISHPMSWALETYMDDKPRSQLHRNKSFKSTSKSSLGSDYSRNVHSMKRIKRESLAHTDDMIYTANDDKPWSCKMCNRKYKWKNSLNCHIKNECNKPPKFFCHRLCGYRTNINSNLKRHLNSNCKAKANLAVDDYC